MGALLFTVATYSAALVATVDARATQEPAAPEAKIKVAVMSIQTSEAIPSELAKSMTALIPQVLDDLGPFKSISSDDIKQMLAIESLKQSLGCDDVSCLAEIGGAIGADYMITGSVITVGTTFLLQFQLMSIRGSKVEERVTREYSGGPAGLLNEIRTVSKLLVRDILAAESGSLAISVTEEGATIKLDGVIIGVSPLEPLSVAGGVHTVAIEKQGFVLFSEDVEISAGETSALEARLLPSEEFKREYGESAKLKRILAWVGISVGTAGLIGTGIMLGVSAGEASTLEQDIQTYNAAGHIRTVAEENELRQRMQGIGTLDTMALVVGAVGVVALTTGLLLFITGDDPDRFEIETSVDVGSASLPPPQVGLMLLPGGLGLAGSF